MVGTINDYLCKIKYHPKNVNLVIDALSRKLGSKSMGDSTWVDSLLEGMRHQLLKDLPLEEVLTTMLRVSELDELKHQQRNDSKLLEIRQRVLRGNRPTHFSLS